ncbi:MAG: ATP-binding cassette domain-containing protein [Bacteroidales bacterium]|nr:ATP-binding cassette domain-containing protein [Bacteroidales bacterium]
MQCSNSHILEIDSVNLSFKEKTVLSGVYLKVETGCVTALLGSNGSGKSCLMRILSGELNADFKSIRIDGVWHEKLTREHILYLPQYCSIPKNITVATAFDDFDIDYEGFCRFFPEFRSFRNYKIGDLSGGTQRMMETYLILTSNAPFVMLDEPFSQITLIDIDKIKQLINREKEHKGILLTDHMYQNVLDVSDNMYVLSERTVYQAKSKEDLIKYGYIRHL